MAPGERFRSGGARGIARFLADHQDCEGGFDVHREQSSGVGRLRIACLGCGGAIAYKAADAGELAAGPTERNGAPAQVPDAAGRPALEDSDPPLERPRGPRPRSGRGRRAGGLSVLLVGLLLGAGLGMVVIGSTRSGDDPEPAGEASTVVDPVTETAPAAIGPAAPETKDAASAPAQPGASATQSAPPPRVRLKRHEFEDLFAVGVPAGWRSGSEDEVVSISHPGGSAELRVFHELGARVPRELAGAAARFLEAEHPGARVSKPRPGRVGGVKCVRIAAGYDGGSETAIVLADAGYTFLILTRVDRGAGTMTAAEAGAATRSFKAKG